MYTVKGKEEQKRPVSDKKTWVSKASKIEWVHNDQPTNPNLS